MSQSKAIVPPRNGDRSLIPGITPLMMKIRRILSAGYTEPAIVLLYLCATLQYVRYYSKATTLYLNMALYLNGQERLPFQKRVLPIFLMRPMIHSQWVATHLVHVDGIFTAERGPLYVINLASMLIAGIFVQKLYNRLSIDHTLRFLVYPLFLFSVMWSYAIHSEANFSYPYDMMSVAFFTVGVYLIYMRRFWPLVAILAVGTFNRETTLFLVGIYILDTASVSFTGPSPRLSKRFDLASVPWLRVALLFAIWLAIRISLTRHFIHNDRSEDFVRLWSNVNRLKPRLWPALLNICGYTLPIVVMLRRFLQPSRFANYLFIFPFWFAVMFYLGVIVETRIYGELCSITAIALVLIIEQYLRERFFGMLDPLAGEVTQVDSAPVLHGTEKAAHSEAVRVS